MSRYRSRVVEVDAFQWTGGDQLEDPLWAVEAIKAGQIWFERQFVWVRSPEGLVRGDPGYWIIRGTEGELYLCKPSIFGHKYEPVEEEVELCKYCDGHGIYTGTDVVSGQEVELACQYCGETGKAGGALDLRPAKWIDFSELGSPYEQRMCGQDEVRYQYRKRGEEMWRAGRPPAKGGASQS